MREELKFRTWSGRVIFTTFTMYDGVVWDPIEDRQLDWPIMQFTGIKDKNGKDIYEGDIMQWEEGEIGVVEYENNGCQFRIKISEGQSCHIGLNVTGRGTAVVIGNIYQNPELLK